MHEISVMEIDLLPKPYHAMVGEINNSLPRAMAASQVFFKSHSQFMTATVDITAVTPLRVIKHTLAEIERTRAALNEAYYNCKRYRVQSAQKRCQASESKGYAADLLAIDAEELEARHRSTINYVGGAIRKLAALLAQYNNLMSKLGVDEITEEDFERDEARYHIMTAMKQALTAARARDGLIDEGNHIYLFDIGISGAQAQAEVTAYLALEDEMISNGKAPTHATTVRWLEACADKWAEEPKKWVESKGMSLYNANALLTRID